MAFPTTLAACSLTPASNGPAGTDLPSDLDDACRQIFALIAQIRDGAGIPTGVALPWLTSAAAPAGWIKLNGAVISRTTYANLFAFATASGLVSEAAWGLSNWGNFAVGDGSTTFRLPDWRSQFIRGLDESRGLDAGRALGVGQQPLVTSHNHSITDPGHLHIYSDPGHSHPGSTDNQGLHAHNYQRASNPVTVNGGIQANVWQLDVANATSTDGLHAHNVVTNTVATGISIIPNGVGITINAQGGADGHPANLAYPHIIKF